METYKAICIKDYIIRDKTGTECTIKRGVEYIISPPNSERMVTVYTTYWVDVPKELFAGVERFT